MRGMRTSNPVRPGADGGADPAERSPGRGFHPAYSLPGGADEEDRLFVAQTGRFLVVAGDSAVAGRLYDARTGTLISPLVCDVAFEDDAFCDVAAAASRRHIVLGAIGHLHVFDHRGRFLRRLDAPDGFELRSGLALDDRRVLVGAVGVQGPTTFVLDLATGAVIVQLVDPAPDDESRFGSAVALLGDIAVVGAPASFTDVPGRVAAFDARTGALLWMTGAPEPAPGDTFGSSLAALRRDVIVGAGAWRLDGRTGAVRAAYRRTDGTAAGRLGAVAAWGRTVAVGDPTAVPDGEVLIFDADSGTLRQTIRQSEPISDPVGFAATLGRSVLAAATGTFENGGRVLVFRR